MGLLSFMSTTFIALDNIVDFVIVYSTIEAIPCPYGTGVNIHPAGFRKISHNTLSKGGRDDEVQ
jgi:hypothetical protein